MASLKLNNELEAVNISQCLMVGISNIIATQAVPLQGV